MNKDKKYAVFTIDVERFKDAECVAKSGYSPSEDMLDGLDKYINILNLYNIKATMFIFNSAVSKIEGKLKSYVNMGHRLALHGGSTHFPSNKMSDSEFENEIKKNKEILEAGYNVKIKGYRAPFFGMSKKKLDILQKLGFRYDSSYLDFSGARYHENMDMSDYENPFDNIFKKKNFCEFGLSNQKLFGCNFPVSGGGYLRLTNWNIMKMAISKYIKEHNYYVFYLHPFELSSKKAPDIRGIKLYDKMYLKYGCLSMPRKVEKIIKMLKKEGYTFITFDELADKV